MPTLADRSPAPVPAPAPAVRLLTADAVRDALAVRDLADPAQGPHAMQLVLADVLDAVGALWGTPVAVTRSTPLVTVADNYDQLGYDPADVTRDARYTRYVAPGVMLRSHTSSGVPAILRGLAADPPRGYDVVHALPGVTHRRDAVDRLHVGTPHQLDLWRVADRGYLPGETLDELAGAVVDAVLPGARWRQVPARHPYTRDGRQVDVRHDGEWVELAECGAIDRGVIRRAGLDPHLWTGVALGMGLDRALMLRKGIPDIRMLRSAHPLVAAQMRDLEPWRPMSSQPAVRRDLSLVVAGDVDDELLGDRARDALGAEADVLESLEVLAVTDASELPAAARERLRTRPGDRNALVRLVLRPLDRTLTDADANVLRDRVYLALHEGEVRELIAGP
ncbi:PheS-related mystery ligase SrmL [Agromyces mangrovi Wang et al. 2018]|uniref:PheS-related mystery ligase SrmL n=1 Tax=Agromyces mangrovi TaxID=1858653 RepID=UPI0025733E06|nr:hypothetical protein [Agromyces mangrovi]BDZ64348.1 hypothetical protein GCM10025877_12860 [Agromyces mangrovi]